MQAARIIPVSGIGSEKEAEQRATSALLAVLTIVRDLCIELLAPLGASRARNATVEAFTEITYTCNGKRIRPDGLVRVTYGKKTWTTLVEVKTGDACLSAEQLNDYWDVARLERFDHVLTVSNEIAPVLGTHPTPGLRVRANSPVQVTHLPWTAILTTAVRLKTHVGVSDPEQAWILGELIRYLEHPASGALAFSDMGPQWVAVRDAARTSTLAKKHEGVGEVASRWDQLLRYAALQLGSRIGADVTPVLPRGKRDPKVRAAELVDQLVGEGRLDGALRIPNTAGDLRLEADLHGQQLVASLEVAAPEDRGARARATWLVGQLKDAPSALEIEAYAKNARTPTTATLADAREDRQALIGEDKRPTAKFRLLLRCPMGTGRKTGGKRPGFIDSVLGLIDAFYTEVVQNVTPWTPPAPRAKRPPSASAQATTGEDRALRDDEGPAPDRTSSGELPTSFHPT